jgi:HAE1 family hydrophobic/amphiphilic exporter-1
MYFRCLGLVLAIGIVVDDAIVVVEAVQVNIEKGMSPKEATWMPWLK